MPCSRAGPHVQAIHIPSGDQIQRMHLLLKCQPIISIMTFLHLKKRAAGASRCLR
jgi:hypothetical protein